MDYLVHRIKLRPGVDPKRFEAWVEKTDYATCPELPSVLTFSVQRTGPDAEAACDYFEIIGVTDRAAFERDMAREAFRGLEQAFDTMAVVVDETAGTLVGAGYTAGGVPA